MNPVDFRKPILLVLVLCTGVSLKPAAAVPGEIRNLGTLGADWRSGALGVNASGQVAGFSDSFVRRAVIYTGWPGNGAMIDLGIPPGSMVTAINASGQMAGMGPTVTGDTHAFRYTGTPGLDGVKHDLGTIGGTPGASQGMAINDSGQVAGFSPIPGGPREHAFRYTGTPGFDGVMHDLGTLGGTYSQGYGINSSGQVVGLSGTTGDAETHAFIYSGTPGSGGFMRDLGTLGGSGSGACAINSNGQVVGTSALEGDVIAHAFLYTGTPGGGGVMHDLDTLGGTYSIARAVNSFGQVVGQSDVAGAFLYTGTPGRDGRMIDLDAWLDTVNPIEGAKWSLHEAVGITDAGLIAGNGYYDDGTVPLGEGYRAFLLDASSLVPEPSCIVLFGFAVPAMLFFRRRSRLPRAVHTAPAFAMISLLFIQTSHAANMTPPGLAEGDKFRIAIVTGGATRVSLVWTGTGPSGGAYLALGEEVVTWGKSPSTEANWMTVSSSFNTTPLRFYGISAELRVPICTGAVC